MSCKNYPYDIRCDVCNGSGDVSCSCCGEEKECGECDGEGVVGIDIHRMNRVIYESVCAAVASGEAHHGTGALIEGGFWVGRTDGVRKWYYRDFAMTPATK